MGLLGKSFRGFVSNQVKVRQKALGEHTSRFSTGNKTKSFLNNTPWIRLASSVNLEKSDDGVYKQMEDSKLFDDVSKFEGDELAKNFILFGGVTDSTGNKQYSGVNKPPNPNSSGKSSSMFGGAYGFGSWGKLFDIDGEGYKPMPGITNMEFSYRNDGALAQATVSIKAFSRSQFQIIDVLYQRPGYTVLLEFGHSVFLDNNGNIQYAGKGGDYQFSTKPFKTLFNKSSKKDLNHYNLSTEINKEKENWQGNYEGAFMKISKFSWKYNMDGSYDVTVNLVGMGDVISSLKTNVTPLIRQSHDKKISEKLKKLKDDGNFLIGNSGATKLNQELYNIYKEYSEAKNIDDIESFQFTIDDFPFPIRDDKGLIKSYKTQQLKIFNGVFVIEDPDTDTDIDDYDNKCYITFGSLISLLTRYVNLKTNGGIPLLFYDFNYISEDPLISTPPPSMTEDEAVETEVEGESTLISTLNGVELNSNNTNFNRIDQYSGDSGFNQLDQPQLNFEIQQTKDLAKFRAGDIGGSFLRDDYNYLATFPGNMSSNPTNILIPFRSPPKTITDQIKDYDLKEKYKKIIEGAEISKKLNKFNSDFFVDNNLKQGRLDRVLLDINYIAKTLDNNTNIDKNHIGECSLIDFLNQILSDINNSLGGINNFRVIYNQEKQLISIVSEIPSNTDETTELSIINTLGLKSTGNEYEGSFVKNVDLKAELNDDFATQISVGAQNDGNRLQGNAGAFSLYNKGLKDRIIPEKIDSQESVPKTTTTTTTTTDNSLINNTITEEYIDALDALYDDLNFEDEYISIIGEINNTLSSLIIGELEKKEEYNIPFFLPFNLGLTLYGLGGIRIYDGFKVDGKMLPPSYNPNEISLIIKSLTHSVSLDGWTTKIETIPKPTAILKKIKTSPKIESSNSFPNFITNPNPSKLEFLPTPINPEDPDRLKAIKQSFNGVFSKHGEESGMCARWTYNLALNYCRALKNNPSIPGKQLAAGGNANWNLQYWRGLVKLGYTQTKVGTNITKSQCNKILSTTVWGYGDVVVYYATEGDPEASYVKYGHTQIYVGKQLQPKIGPRGGWSTSTRNNYKTNFVYNKKPSNKWDFIVFRAPENASQVIL